MEPVAVYEAREGSLDIPGLLTARPDDNLDRLAELSIDTDAPLIIEENGKRIGVVTKKTLIRGIQGRLTRQGPDQ